MLRRRIHRQGTNLAFSGRAGTDLRSTVSNKWQVGRAATWPAWVPRADCIATPLPESLAALLPHDLNVVGSPEPPAHDRDRLRV